MIIIVMIRVTTITITAKAITITSNDNNYKKYSKKIISLLMTLTLMAATGPQSV